MQASDMTYTSKHLSLAQTNVEIKPVSNVKYTFQKCSLSQTA